MFIKKDHYQRINHVKEFYAVEQRDPKREIFDPYFSQPDREGLKIIYTNCEKAAKFFTCAYENRENWAPLSSRKLFGTF